MVRDANVARLAKCDTAIDTDYQKSGQPRRFRPAGGNQLVGGMTDPTHHPNPSPIHSVPPSGASNGVQKSTTKPDLLPSPQQIVEHLDRHIIGHRSAKEMLATACYNHLLSCAIADMTGDDVWPDNHVILAGNSGSGKSAMLTVLGRHLGVPVIEIDCSNLSPAGYRGTNLANIYSDLEERLVESGVTRPALLIWEEIDKLRDAGDEAGRYRRMTQTDALRYLDGATCGSSGSLNPSRILSIGCGAFGGLDRIQNPELAPRIGFESAHKLAAPNGRNTQPSLDPEHLVKFGLITEFVGRFSRFAMLDPLDQSVMRRIITDSESSVFRRKVEHFRQHNVRLSFTDEALDVVAKIAMEHPVGARGLRLILNRILAPWEYQLPLLAAMGIAHIEYTKAAVVGLECPVIHHAEGIKNNETLLDVRHKAIQSEPPEEDDGDDISIF